MSKVLWQEDETFFSSDLAHIIAQAQTHLFRRQPRRGVGRGVGGAIGSGFVAWWSGTQVFTTGHHVFHDLETCSGR